MKLPILLVFSPTLVFASGSPEKKLDLTSHWVSYSTLALFLLRL